MFFAQKKRREEEAEDATGNLCRRRRRLTGSRFIEFAKLPVMTKAFWCLCF